MNRRRGRQGNRNNAPPPRRYSPYPYRNHQSSGYRRSYASVVRNPYRADTATRSNANQTHDPYYGTSQHWTLNSDHSTRRPQRDRYFYRTRDTDSRWWRTAPNIQRAPPTSRPWDRRRTGAVGDRQRDTPRSSDPDFTFKVRILHRLIKAVHHLQNVSDGDPPITIRRMTGTLSTGIKPAAPTEGTMMLIDANAKNWAHTTMIILRDHYIDMIDKEIQTLIGLTDPNWKQPFEIATVWARRNLGRRLLPETVERAEALLIVRVTNRDQPDPSYMTKDKTGPQQTNPAPDRVETHTLTTQTVTTIQGRQGPSPPTVDPTLTPPRRNQHVVTAEIHRPPTTIEMPLETTIPKSPTSTPMAPSTSRKTSATMTDITGGWSPEIQVEEEEEIIPPTPFPPLHASRDISWAAPKERRTRRTSDPRPSQQQPSITFQPVPLPSLNTSTPEDPAPIVDLTDNEPPALLNSPDRPRHSISLRARKPTTPGLTSRAASSTVQSQIDFTGPTAQTVATTRRATRHINTPNKLRDWNLSVRKKWLIVGDSNVARFPPFQMPDLQVDSFPGATFRHAETILLKATIVTSVETVILSFGLNNRSQKTRQTTIKQMQRAMKVAKQRFPLATIWVPLINFSRALPHQEQTNLHDLNVYIHTNYDSIPELGRTQFSTERDKIHWTHETASHMLTHWAKHVKGNSP